MNLRDKATETARVGFFDGEELGYLALAMAQVHELDEERVGKIMYKLGLLTGATQKLQQGQSTSH